jgi:hypothetical protein
MIYVERIKYADKEIRKSNVLVPPYHSIETIREPVANLNDLQDKGARPSEEKNKISI